MRLYGSGVRRALRCGLFLLAFYSLALAQSLSFLPECAPGSPEPVCLSPEIVFRLGLNRVDGVSPEGRLSFGVKLAARAVLGGFELKLRPAVWVDPTLQADLLEAQASTELGPVGLSLGKRTDYSGPWDETLVGRGGAWGLFAHYRPPTLGWLMAEAAYLPNPGLAGGRAFLGVRVGPVRAGSFLEVVGGAGLVWTPRVGLEGGESDVYWQSDRGFWTDLHGPLPLGQILAYSLRCPPGGNALCWGRGLPEESDSALVSLLHTLDEGRFGLLLWWNPDWALLGSTDPDTGDTQAFLDWLTRPKKFFFGLSTGLQQYRLGLDLSLAPVGAYRIYLELHLP